MTSVPWKKGSYAAYKIVDKLVEDNKIFRNSDKTKLVEFLSSLMEKLPP